MVIVGIDPGGNGGITRLTEDGDIIESHALTSDQDDLVELVEQVLQEGDQIWIEDVHSMANMSAKSNFSFGGAVIGIQLLVKAAGFDYKLVQPKIWQSYVWKDEDIVLKEGTKRKTKDTKATSLNAANRIFPGEEWHKSKRAYTPHDGMYDSALIAYYGVIMNKKK